MAFCGHARYGFLGFCTRVSCIISLARLRTLRSTAGRMTIWKSTVSLLCFYPVTWNRSLYTLLKIKILCKYAHGVLELCYDRVLIPYNACIWITFFFMYHLKNLYNPRTKFKKILNFLPFFYFKFFFYFLFFFLFFIFLNDNQYLSHSYTIKVNTYWSA